MEEMSHPVFSRQRFWKFRLNELFNLDSVIVQEYAEASKNVIDLTNRIILDIEYPFHLGQPTDSHQLLTFHTYKKCIDLDFWHKADETCALRKGDCEDSSIFFVTAARILGLSEKEVYEVFGVVRDATTGEVLGGHGWAYFWYDGWRLYESTLDAYPKEYPKVGVKHDEVTEIREPIRLENVVYDPEFLFNDKEYHFVKGIVGGKVYGR